MGELSLKTWKDKLKQESKREGTAAFWKKCHVQVSLKDVEN